MVRYLHPTDHNSRSIRKIAKLYEDKLDFKNMKFPVKARDIHKFERMREFKYYERKIKSPFMIYTDFQSILVAEDIGKQNPNEFYTNKYQKHVACSYDYKSVCVHDTFSKPFRLYLCEDAVYNFINTIIDESKYRSDAKNKNCNKRLVMTIKNNEDFKNSTKCWFNGHIDGDVQVRDHSYVTGKYRGSAHTDFNIKVKLNHKIPVVFNSLKS